MLNFPTRLAPVGTRHGLLNALFAFQKLFMGIAGPEHLKDASDVNYYYNSGKAALVCGLNALSDLEPNRDEVVVSAYTCFSVPAAINKAGLKIVLCDIQPDTLDFDYAMLNKLVNKNTLCVISTHLFAVPPQITKAKAIVDQVKAYLIEDAAQADYSKVYKQDQIADLTILSFGRGKPISSMGGGMLITKNPDINERVKTQYCELPTPGMKQCLMKFISVVLNDILLNPFLYWIPARIKYLGIGETTYPGSISISKMSPYQEYLLTRMYKVGILLGEIRRANTAFFLKTLEGLKFERRVILNGIENYSPVRFPLYINNKIETLDYRKKHLALDLGVVPMYPTGLHRLMEIKEFWCNQNDRFPGSEWISEHLMTLPTHQLLNDEWREKIAEFVETDMYGP